MFSSPAPPHFLRNWNSQINHKLSPLQFVAKQNQQRIRLLNSSTNKMHIDASDISEIDTFTIWDFEKVSNLVVSQQRALKSINVGLQQFC